MSPNDPADQAGSAGDEDASPPRIRVLLLDPWVRASLAACRAIGRSPIWEVGVAGYERGRRFIGPAAASKFVVHRHLLPHPGGPAEPFQRELERVVRTHGYAAVLATADVTLARLGSIDVSVPTSPHLGSAFKLLNDKAALADVAARAAVDYPATVLADNESAVRTAARTLGLPLIIKSRRTAEADHDAVQVARGATVAGTAEEATAAVRRMNDIGMQAIAQQRVATAGKVNAVVIRRAGRSEVRYAHRVHRETPVTGGIGVTLETIATDSGDGAEAADALERVCDVAGYEGLAQAEFCRSAEGRLHLVDVNPRLWGSTWFGERLGLRISERSLRFALGLPPLPIARYEVGRRFHAPFGEMRWARQQRHPLRAMMTLASEIRPGDVVDYWDRGDLRPVAVLVGLVVGGYRPE